jgi:hypothetical protein
MSGVGSELSRISRLSHESVFDAWLIQLRAVLVLRDLDQFINNAPARNQSDQVAGDKRALAIVTLAVDERLQPTAAAASNTKTALKSLRAATQGSLLDPKRGVEDRVVKLKQGAKESLTSYCQRAEALEQQLLVMQKTGMQPMLIDRFLQGLRSAPLKAALASTADLIREESVTAAVSTVRSHAPMIGPEALLPEASVVGNDEENPGTTTDKLGPAAFSSTATSRVQQGPSRYRGHWCFAAYHCTRIYNRLPHSVLECTPWEACFGVVPDVSDVRVFGCHAFVHLKRPTYMVILTVSVHEFRNCTSDLSVCLTLPEGFVTHTY